MSITIIETFSNELFYLVFDYLDGCEIYQAFSNLNHRFEQLINSLSLLYKINYDYSQSKEVFMNNYQQIFLHNKNQIVSIHLWLSEIVHEILLSVIFDSSFNCLKSLILYTIKPVVLIPLLQKLISLPRLCSLVIDTESDQKDLGNIYQFIFNLSKLKYFKFSAMESNDIDITISLPIATNEQISSIEHLVIDHPCAVDELFTIISYTPQLHHLKFLNLTDRNVNIRSLKLMTLSNLTHLSIHIYEMSFDQFEIFIQKLNSKLNVLSFTTIVEDINYLDANRWENFILKNLSQLKTFYFKYSTRFEDNYQVTMYLGQRNQFISSFWIERQWILETEIESDSVIYSIHPYKNRWYEYERQDKMINQFSKSIRLMLSTVSPEFWFKSLHISQYIDHVLTVTQIYHLEIHQNVLIDKFCEILYLLPELDSLQIYSLSFSKENDLSEEELEDLAVLSTKNQITKVHLQKMTHVQDIFILILTFPRLNHLQIDCIDYMHAESLLGFILTEIKTKSNNLLRLLCFTVPAADNEMVQKLKTMIVDKNLLCDFTVKRVMNQIYVQWK